MKLLNDLDEKEFRSHPNPNFSTHISVIMEGRFTFIAFKKDAIQRAKDQF